MTNVAQRNFAPALTLLFALISLAGTVSPASAKGTEDYVKNAHCGKDCYARFYQLPVGQRKAGFGKHGIASVIQNSGEPGDVAGVSFVTPFETQRPGGFNIVVFNYQLGSGFTHSLVTFCFRQADGSIFSITRPLDSLPEAPGQTLEWGAIVVTPDDLGIDHTYTLIKTTITVSIGKQNIGYMYVGNVENIFTAPDILKFDEDGCSILEFCDAEQELGL